MPHSNDPVWLRRQETIRKLLLATGHDALVSARSALERVQRAGEAGSFLGECPQVL